MCDRHGSRLAGESPVHGPWKEGTCRRRQGCPKDGFPEAVANLALRGLKEGRSSFDRLLDLAQIQRPLAALVVDANRVLSAEVKSFGLIHYLGSEPSTKKSLAVQTLLRDEDSSDDESIKDIIHPCEERDLVTRVLKDYQQLYLAVGQRC